MFQRSNLWWKTLHPFMQTFRRGATTKLNTSLPGIANNTAVSRCFRTSTAKNVVIPPHLVVFSAKFLKFGTAIGARVAKSWWQKLPQERKLKLLERTKKYKIVIFGLISGAGYGGYLYYDAHIQETPITKRKRFIAFTEEQFSEISKRHLKTLLRKYKRKIHLIFLLPEHYKRVERVATKLLLSNLDLKQIHNKDWTITIVEDDRTLNAFVLPCGSIFVFTGLLKYLTTDDELAIILGHEMAHAVLSHGCETASFMHLLDLLLIVPLSAIWALFPMDILAAFSHYISTKLTKYFLELPYSRFLETEADEVGLHMAAKACYDVRAAPVVWAKMSCFNDPLDIEWLSTHPSSEIRQAQLEEWLPNAYKLRDSCKCCSLPAKDPRDDLQIFKIIRDVPEEESLLRLKIQPT